MTEGERMVWAAAYVAELNRHGSACIGYACKMADQTVEQLRAVAKAGDLGPMAREMVE